MNQIVRISYECKGDVKAGYFIKTHQGLIPIDIRRGEFVAINTASIISEVPVSINTVTGRMENG